MPEGYPFDPIGAYLEAKANLARAGSTPPSGGSSRPWLGAARASSQSRELLRQIYEIEVRFDDVKALLRASLAEAEDPIRDLKELSNFDLSGCPTTA